MSPGKDTSGNYPIQKKW